MNGTQMFYREVVPAADLALTVMSFWEFVVLAASSEPIEHEIFPDGCVSVFYLRNLNRHRHYVGLSGLQLETVTKVVSGGDIIWGMRLSPAACSAILDSDPAKVRSYGGADADLFPHLTHGLSEKLAAATSFDDAILIFEDRVREVIANRGTCDSEIAKVVRLIEESRGEIRVDEIARSISLSTRQFQRRFKAISGLSPKQYIRARRIRAAAVDLVESRGQNLGSSSG